MTNKEWVYLQDQIAAAIAIQYPGTNISTPANQLAAKVIVMQLEAYYDISPKPPKK